MDLPPRPKQAIKIYLEEGGYIIENGKKTEDTFIYYHHVDGMYSYCKTPSGETVHLSVGTPLEEYEDGYRIVDERDASAD